MTNLSGANLDSRQAGPARADPMDGISSELESFVPLIYKRRGVQRLTETAAPAQDTTFLEGLSRAFYWRHLLDTGVMKSGSEISRTEGFHHWTVNELLRLTLLAPDIIELLMAGQQPRRLTMMWFQRNPLPLDSKAQCEIIECFE